MENQVINYANEAEISSLAEAVEKLRAADREISAKIRAASERVQSIQCAPLTREDFIASVLKLVQDRAVQFESIMLDWFDRDRINAEYFRISPNGEYPYQPLDLLIRQGAGGYEQIAVCALFGEVIADFVRRMADRMSWPGDAIPLAQRPELLGAAQAELQGLLAESQRVQAALGGSAAR